MKSLHFLSSHFSINCSLALVLISFPCLSLRWLITSVLLNPADISHYRLSISEAFYLILHFLHLETLFTQGFHGIQLLVFLPPLRPLFSICFTDSPSSSLHVLDSLSLSELNVTASITIYSTWLSPKSLCPAKISFLSYKPVCPIICWIQDCPEQAWTPVNTMREGKGPEGQAR